MRQVSPPSPEPDTHHGASIDQVMDKLKPWISEEIETRMDSSPLRPKQSRPSKNPELDEEKLYLQNNRDNILVSK